MWYKFIVLWRFRYYIELVSWLELDGWTDFIEREKGLVIQMVMYKWTFLFTHRPVPRTWAMCSVFGRRDAPSSWSYLNDGSGSRSESTAACLALLCFAVWCGVFTACPFLFPTPPCHTRTTSCRKCAWHFLAAASRRRVTRLTNGVLSALRQLIWPFLLATKSYSTPHIISTKATEDSWIGGSTWLNL